MKTLIYSALALSLIMLASCGGDSDPPVVTITAPADNATFMTTDTMDVTFLVTDDVDIAAIVFDSPGLATGNILASDLASEADLTFNGIFSVPCNVTEDTYTVSIIATDSDDNTSSAEISVNIR